MARTTAEAFVLLAALCACAPSAAEGDAATEDVFAHDDATSIDAASTCTLTPPDALPALGGDFVVLDPDAGFQVPAQDGGNPIGVWRGEHVTIFAQGPFDAAASRVSGTAWVVVSASEVQFSLLLDLSIASSEGTTTHHDVLALEGSYRQSGVTLHVAPRCAAPALDLDFTTGDSSGTLLLRMNGALGEETLLLHCARTST